MDPGDRRPFPWARDLLNGGFERAGARSERIV